MQCCAVLSEWRAVGVVLVHWRYAVALLVPVETVDIGRVTVVVCGLGGRVGASSARR